MAARRDFLRTTPTGLTDGRRIDGWGRRARRLASSASVALAGLAFVAPALADEPGPALRPPGLDPDAPVDRIIVGDDVPAPSGGTDDLNTGWELNAADVVYSAAKKRQLVSEAPSTVHVITDRQIERYGWRSLTDVMRMVPGVQTRTWLAQYQSVMIRGLLGTEVNNTRILWLENGVPANDTRDGGIWLDDAYPVELIKRVEVVLGPGSALYGTGAFQGVVNIFTKDPKDVPESGEYRFAYGFDNTIKSSALAAYDGTGWGVLGFVSASTTDGPGLISDFQLRQAERQAGATAVRSGDSPLDPAYDPGTLEPNSGRTWINGHVKALFDPVRLSASVRYVDAGFDGAEFFPAERYQFNRLEMSTDALVDTRLSEDWGLVALVGYRYQQNAYEDYFDLDLESVVEIEAFDDVVNDPRYPSRLNEKVTYDADQHKVFSLVQAQWQIIESNELIFGIGGRYEAVLAPDFQDGRTEQDFLNASVFVQDEQRFFDDTLILTAGGRFDTHREFGPQLSFRGAVLYKWTDWILSRLSYGTAFREPSMSQLYLDHFNAVGTPDLDAETLQNVELSTVVEPTDGVTLRLDGFATFMDNLIIDEFDDTQAVPFLGIEGKFVSRQQTEARILGFELAGRAELPAGFSLFAHYNFLDSRGGTDELERLDYDAAHRAGLGTAWETDGAIASLMGVFVGPTTDSSASAPGENVAQGTRDVPAYVLIQPSGQIRLPGDLALLVQGDIALSEGLTETPTRDYYYEMLGVPVSRYDFLVGLRYPWIERRR